MSVYRCLHTQTSHPSRAANPPPGPGALQRWCMATMMRLQREMERRERERRERGQCLGRQARDKTPMSSLRNESVDKKTSLSCTRTDPLTPSPTHHHQTKKPDRLANFDVALDLKILLRFFLLVNTPPGLYRAPCFIESQSFCVLYVFVSDGEQRA